MVTIYHNPRCRKSREALNALEEKGIEFQVIQYLKEPLTEAKLKDLLSKLDMKPADLIRKNEAVWKSDYKGQKLTNTDLIQAMTKHPKLIERPIVVKGSKAIVARPAERLSELL